MLLRASIRERGSSNASACHNNHSSRCDKTMSPHLPGVAAFQPPEEFRLDCGEVLLTRKCRWGYRHG
jgi:hypothetical protein